MHNQFFSARMGKALAFLFVVVTTSFTSKVSAQINPQWTLDTTIQNVGCYHMITKCGNEDAVLLKFVNHRSSTTIISWDGVFTTNLSQPASHPGGRQSLNLAWGESLATDCSGDNKTYYIVASDIDPSCTAITGFSFNNISFQ